MNIDERIRNALENESEELGRLTSVSSRQGMFSLAMDAYKGGLGRWMYLVTIILFITGALLVWTGYNFFTSSVLDDRIFWGVCLILSITAHGSLKQWSWMEMNRNSVIREVKRLEVAVERLEQKLEGGAPSKF